MPEPVPHRLKGGGVSRMAGERTGILMVISHFPPAVGGTERQAHSLAAGLVRAGHRVTVVTLARTDAPPREVLDGVRVERTLIARGCGLAFAATYGLSLLRHLRRLRSDHVIFHAHHLYLEAMAASWAGMRTGLPAIAKVACGGPDGDFARLRRTRTSIGLPLLRRLRCVVALSTETQAELLTHGFAPERIARIPNGVDLVRFAPVTDLTTAQTRVGLGPETVLFLGRLDPQKGLDVALAAWARVVARRPTAQLVLAGDGPARRMLETQVGTVGLGASVRFLGARPDPEALLGASQVFLLPSRSEGLSNALLEAMATGLACVASRIGGNSDVLEHGVTGLLIPTGDPGALADALDALLDDASLRSRLGTAARAVALDQYGMDRVIQQYADLYAGLVGGRT